VTFAQQLGCLFTKVGNMIIVEIKNSRPPEVLVVEALYKCSHGRFLGGWPMYSQNEHVLIRPLMRPIE
jgi:hypothetical protein